MSTPPCIARSAKKLQPHQSAVVKAFIKSPKHGICLIHAAGSGKTLSSIAAGKCFLDQHPNGHIILITQASLIAGFKAELKGYEPKVNIAAWSFYTYTSFAMASAANELNVCDGALVIVDEVQNLREAGGAIYKHVHKCTAAAIKVILLSATPIVNSPTDIAAIMALANGEPAIDKHLLERILDNEKLARAYFGCQLSFYAPDPKTLAAHFPKKEERFVPIVMDAPTLKTYTNLENDRITRDIAGIFNLSGDTADTNLAAFFSGLRAISEGSAQKIKYVTDFIWHVHHQKTSKSLGITAAMLAAHTDKFIIFTHFKDHGSRLIVTALKQRGIESGLVDGSISKEGRKSTVDRYVRGDLKVIIISAAGTTGLNLLETGYMFLMASSWTNTETIQVIARSVRYQSHSKLPKSKRNVLVMRLMLIKPAESRDFARIIADKKRYEDLGAPPSIDIKMFVDAMRKQQRIDAIMHMLEEKMPTVEDCAARNISIESLASLRTYKRVGRLPTAPTVRASGVYFAPGRQLAPPNDRISLNDAMLREIIAISGALRFTTPTAILFAGSIDILVAAFVAANSRLHPHIHDGASAPFSKKFRLAIINWGLNFATGMRPAYPQRPNGPLRAITAAADVTVIIAPGSRADSIRSIVSEVGAHSFAQANYESKFDLIVGADIDPIAVIVAARA